MTGWEPPYRFLHDVQRAHGIFCLADHGVAFETSSISYSLMLKPLALQLSPLIAAFHDDTVIASPFLR
jgi:hypothetical protein